MTHSNVLGARVRAARDRKGWTREQLAVESGVSWSGIAQVESGRRRNLRPGTLSALAGALGVTLDYLVRGGPVSPPMLEHRALLYAGDDELAQGAGPFLIEGLERSEPVLALTTRANIELLRGHLGADARRVEFVESDSWLTTPSSTLQGFRAYLSAKLEEGAAWTRILGEPIWKGRSDEEVRQWTRFESLLNLVFASWPVSMLCPYDERSLDPEILRQARLTHPGSDYVDPGDFALG